MIYKGESGILLLTGITSSFHSKHRPKVLDMCIWFFKKKKVKRFNFLLISVSFRQKKLEQMMEEEGLKDEEVINLGKLF